MSVSNGLRCMALTALFACAGAGAWAADEGIWSVSKASGEVWVTTTGASQVSLRQQETLKPGDTIRTGRNGRVLLVRGEETILISPNSVIGVPLEKKNGLSTTITQQAGSILLEVEKRNVKHFEVETPYLAAVVKGTQFSVTVSATSTSVEVSRGQVEVSDFRSGQIAQVMPGQVATTFAHGKAGLSLSGAGTFNPIEQGKPRASSIERVPVPKSGLSAPRNASNGYSTYALRQPGTSIHSAATATSGVTRISTALGEVRLDFHKVTHGLARASGPQGTLANASKNDTAWSDAKASMSGTNGGSDNAMGNGNSTSSGIAATLSVISGSATNSGNGNGGSANANNGQGFAFAGNGNNGNGGGNGNGNGLRLGLGKH